jgi:hypothetical protein
MEPKSVAEPSHSGRIPPTYDFSTPTSALLTDPGLSLDRQQYMNEIVATAATPKKKRSVKRKTKVSVRKTAKKSTKKANPPKKSMKTAKKISIERGGLMSDIRTASYRSFSTGDTDKASSIQILTLMPPPSRVKA